MAFKKTETSKHGIVCVDAYHAIRHVDGDLKRVNGVRVVVGVYKDRAAKLAGKEPLDSRPYVGLTLTWPPTEDIFAELYPQIKASNQNAGFLNDAEDVDPD